MTDAQALCGMLDALCPMHVVLSPTGHVRHAGPTLQKLRPDGPMEGRRFLEVVEFTRPRQVRGMDDLMAAAGIRLHLRLRDAPPTALKGVLVPVPGGEGAIMNLSFGISILEGVRDYALSSADFAATDLAVEMLYLVEAKSAAMEASRKLNLRLRGAMIAAEEQAFTDTLTGLKNRRAVEHILPRLIEGGGPFAVLQADLDFFKQVNDERGHAAGDAVLQRVAGILVEETRGSDCVARIGGDEFVVIFGEVDARARLARIAERIIARIETPIPFDGQVCRISISIGIALSEETRPLCMAEILADADAALYACKRRGRACFAFFEPEMRPDGM
ncbi:diguanylate cyclase (GGDEF) domain-containing protein [Salinihabitans flavidus]|uniref:Diguanylate cyclase (GGDEF) domain-containing protein n=1 Tax=Salinihabitans flavidus TaxID=569882 RepID=A0A1H8TSN5_9RHOB|nr:GGDEF domain-containing protein [Salinihabitans flavidus]SEO93448.1 diguanylate cyclase (GGDEF) domain-containing protein [Salinihabitans flavidus]